MKKLLSILTLVLTSTFSWANEVFINFDEISDTIVTTVNSELIFRKALVEELIDGLWVQKTVEPTTTTTTTTTLQFNDAGLVGLLTTATSGVAKFDHLHWHLEGFDTNTFLIFTDMDKDLSQTYLLKKMSYGITMIDVEEGKILELHHQPLSEVKELKETQKALTGTWNSNIHYTTENDENKLVSFNYELKANGTFQRKIACSFSNTPARIKTAESGYWQISPNGTYLVLHFETGENVYATQLAKINYLAYDELVLAAFFADIEVQKEMEGVVETFFFNKE